MKHTFDSVSNALDISRDTAVAGIATITLSMESPDDERFADVSEKARLIGFERLSATEFCTSGMWTSIWHELADQLRSQVRFAVVFEHGECLFDSVFTGVFAAACGPALILRHRSNPASAACD